MTVRELIEVLGRFDPNMRVKIDGEYDPIRVCDALRDAEDPVVCPNHDGEEFLVI